MEHTALLVIDVQNGFIDRELPVPDGATVVPIINRLMPMFSIVVASQDWHPANHGSFASQYDGRKPFELGELSGQPQVLWPDHCVAGTAGAEFHPHLDMRPVQCIIRKGMDKDVDSYSAFQDNCGKNPSGLEAYLRGRGVRRIYVCGLALDYCVRFSALDALRVTDEVLVIEDASRAVSPITEAEAWQELGARGVKRVRSDQIGERSSRLQSA